MAKRKAVRGQASESIREVLEAGAASTAEIKTALAAKGVSASDALINNVRSRWKKAKGLPMGRCGRRGARKKRAVSAQRTDSPTPAARSAASSNGDTLGAAIVFIRAVGGIEKARNVLAQLAEIKSL